MNWLSFWEGAFMGVFCVLLMGFAVLVTMINKGKL